MQAGDSEAWKELFDPSAVLLDDGHPRDLERFSDEAVGHQRFASIDPVVNPVTAYLLQQIRLIAFAVERAGSTEYVSCDRNCPD